MVFSQSLSVICFVCIPEIPPPAALQAQNGFAVVGQNGCFGPVAQDCATYYLCRDDQPQHQHTRAKVHTSQQTKNPSTDTAPLAGLDQKQPFLSAIHPRYVKDLRKKHIFILLYRWDMEPRHYWCSVYTWPRCRVIVLPSFLFSTDFTPRTLINW